MQVYEIETQDFMRYSADADCTIFHDKHRKNYRVEWQDGTLIVIPESKVINFKIV